MTIIERKELNKFVTALLSMCVLAHLRRREMRKRHLPHDDDTPESKLHRVDHPCFGYLFENLFVFGMAYLAAKANKPMDFHKHPIKTLLNVLVFMTIMTEPKLVVEKFMASKVFSHVPYFSPRAPPSDFLTIAREYLQCNSIVTLVSAALLMVVAACVDRFAAKETYDNMFGHKPAGVKFWPYLAKFAYCRVFVDVLFGVLHRAMHESPALYNLVHRRHHEHQTPRTQTNLHFEWLDLYLEASFPVYVAVGSLLFLGHGPSRYEQPFLVLPLIYYESCSHTGKEIPIVTWFPLLSPLVDWITGCDQRLIEYHTRHHQLYRCNYSISPWVDKLWGTYRIDLPDSYNALNKSTE